MHRPVVSRVIATTHRPWHGRHASTWCTVASIVAGVPFAFYTYKCLMMVAFQNKLIYLGYIPWGSRKEVYDAAIHHVPTLHVQEQQLGALHGFVVTRLAEKATLGPHDPVVIYFQGNAGNMIHRLPLFRTVLEAVPRLTIVAMSYRGYGNSKSRATERHLQQDAQKVLDFVWHRYGRAPYLYGHSLGGAVAIHLAASCHPHRLRGVVVENTFTSIADMVQALYPRYTPYPWLARWCLWNRWDSQRLVEHVSVPILFLSSTHDEIVPASHMHTLYDHATHSPRKVFCDFEKALHMDMYTSQATRFKTALAQFIR